MSPRTLTLILCVFGAAALRLLPHWPNFTPVAAVALFAGAQIDNRRLAVIVPLAALFLSDWILGFYPGMPFVYTGFLISILIGFVLRRHSTVTGIAFGAVASATVFFLLSNLGVWWAMGLYPKTPAGLMEAYLAGIPFLRETLASNALYVTLLFGGIRLLERYMPRFVRLTPESS